MIAFKTYKDCPNNIKPASIPEVWVWTQLEIPDHLAESFEQSGFTVLSFQDFIAYKAEHQEVYDQWANAADQNREGEEVRVYDLTDDSFNPLPLSKIDFRRHLKDNIYLQKSVTMLPNGRPLVATYTLEGVAIAEIEFTFETNAFNFMSRRIEKLSYYKRNNTKTEQWVIADDVYDEMNPYHLREMMKERSEARGLILEGVKAFLNGVLAQVYLPQGKTYLEILAIAGDFWGAYSNDIDSWINVGSPRFAMNLTADAQFEFLNANVAEGVTVRQYVLNKTSY